MQVIFCPSCRRQSMIRSCAGPGKHIWGINVIFNFTFRFVVTSPHTIRIRWPRANNPKTSWRGLRERQNESWVYCITLLIYATHLNASSFCLTAVNNKHLLKCLKYGLCKETHVYIQSQGPSSWMLGYGVLGPFFHRAIFSRHKCLPAKITWIWIVCSAVLSGLLQDSNDSDRQPVCSIVVQ